jgi:hypothetical protein
MSKPIFLTRIGILTSHNKKTVYPAYVEYTVSRIVREDAQLSKHFIEDLQVLSGLMN